MTDAEIVHWILVEVEHGAVGRVAPHDRGGFTQWGVTARAYADFHRRSTTEGVTLADLQAITYEQAAMIWTELFLRRTKFDQVEDWRLRLTLVQWAGNAGASACIRGLQTILLVVVDGVVGPKTLNAIAVADPVRLRDRLLASQAAGWLELMRRDAEQRANAAGWLRRLATVLEAV